VDCGGSTVTAGGGAGAEIVDTGLGRKFLVGDGDKLEGSVRGGRSPFSIPSFSLNLPVRSPSPKATPSKRAEPGLTGSLLLPLTLPPVGWGERDLSPNVVGFEVAICSKCERREDTGFWRVFCQRDQVPHLDMIDILWTSHLGSPLGGPPC
jgi:hypothetical protein